MRLIFILLFLTVCNAVAAVPNVPISVSLLYTKNVCGDVYLPIGSYTYLVDRTYTDLSCSDIFNITKNRSDFYFYQYWYEGMTEVKCEVQVKCGR